MYICLSGPRGPQRRSLSSEEHLPVKDVVQAGWLLPFLPTVPRSALVFTREASFLSLVCLVYCDSALIHFLGLAHFLSLVQFKSLVFLFLFGSLDSLLEFTQRWSRQSSNELNKADDPRKHSPVCLNGPKHLQCESALSSCRCGKVGRRRTLSLCAFIIKH